MKKFEYNVLEKFPTGMKGEKKLNELGAQGWELVCVNADGNSLMKSAFYIFKREVG